MRTKYLLYQDKHSTVKLPLAFIPILNTSFNNCEHCYVNFKKDTTITIHLMEGTFLHPFKLVDLNFDGLVDFGFPSRATCCSGNNITFDTWLYNEKDSAFVYHQKLSTIPIWALQPKNKTIESGWHMGRYDFTKQTYS